MSVRSDGSILVHSFRFNLIRILSKAINNRPFSRHYSACGTGEKTNTLHIYRSSFSSGHSIIWNISIANHVYKVNRFIITSRNAPLFFVNTRGQQAHIVFRITFSPKCTMYAARYVSKRVTHHIRCVQMRTRAACWRIAYDSLEGLNEDVYPHWWPVINIPSWMYSRTCLPANPQPPIEIDTGPDSCGQSIWHRK